MSLIDTNFFLSFQYNAEKMSFNLNNQKLWKENVISNAFRVVLVLIQLRKCLLEVMLGLLTEFLV